VLNADQYFLSENVFKLAYNYKQTNKRRSQHYPRQTVTEVNSKAVR